MWIFFSILFKMDMWRLASELRIAVAFLITFTALQLTCAASCSVLMLCIYCRLWQAHISAAIILPTGLMAGGVCVCVYEEVEWREAGGK